MSSNFPINNELKGSQRRENYIKNKYPSFYKYLIDNYPNNISFKEKLYWYYNNIHSHPICEECKKLLKFRDGKIGYGKFCSSKCSANNKDVINNRNSIRRSKQDIINKKTTNTIIEKYGSLEEFNKNRLNKTKQTNLKKYGVEYYTNREKSKITRRLNYKLIHNDIIDIISDNNSTYYICKCDNNSCNKCDEKIFKILNSIYHTRKYQGIEICTILNPLGYDGSNTSIELFVESLLNKYNIEYIHNDRKILNGKELDFYIPSKNLAIECNGVFWHSDRNVEKDYHNIKYNDCQNNNIQLLTLWEDQFKNKPDIIESIILSKLNIYDTRIYARKCIIKEVSSKESKQFLISNHLQGNCNSAIKIGLYYNNELVSLMTFGNLRKSLGNKSKENTYELYRFCNKLNTQVIGGASKLFKYFIKQYNPFIIESFSSNDISNGDLYKFLNFLKDSSTISYWYIEQNNNLIRHHRYKFRKSELIKMGFDKNKTEFDIMNDMKNYYRIYDSGQTKWVWNKNNL